MYIYIYILSRAADPCPTCPHEIASAIRMLRPGCGHKTTMSFPIAAPLLFQVTKVKYGVEINPNQLNLTCNYRRSIGIMLIFLPAPVRE